MGVLRSAEITEKALTLAEYLKLVDETGRQIVADKKSISCEVAPILERLKINTDEWVKQTEFFRDSFRRVVGPEEVIKSAAKKVKKCWFQGLRAARKLFAAVPTKSPKSSTA